MKYDIDSEWKERDSLQKEFYTLRKGAGLTLWKLERLVVLPSIISKLLNTEQAALSGDQLHAYLLHEIDSLGDTPEAQALRNSFALDSHQPGSLTKRRQQLATQLVKHVDTIEAYENRAIRTIVRRLLSQKGPKSTPALPPEQPQKAAIPSSNRMESALRSLVSQGLGELLSVDSRTSELLRCFSPSTPPYMDTSVEWLFLPSSRGKGWYSQRLRYTFRRQKDCFRIAITSSARDSEALMLSGIVDEVVKLDRPPHSSYEMTDLLQSVRFVVKEESGRQQIFPFTELGTTATHNLLNQLWQINADDCRIVEASIPQEKVLPNTVYEYWLTCHLRTDEHYAFWYSPSLMFLNNIVVDISRFPEREKWQMHILPFFGHVFPGTLESTGDRFTMPANSWIMQGHGIALSWQEKV